MITKGLFLLIVGITVIVVPLTLENVYRMTGPDYQFQYHVHSYMYNAYYSNTPELMIDQLKQSVEGMRTLGLTEDMYGAWLPWEITPDRSMRYQYQHMDNVIERASAVWAWRNETYDVNTSGSETLGDVYEAKMDNLRFFLIEGGWSDWIARDSFLVNRYFWLVVYGSFVSALLFIVGCIVACIGLLVWINANDGG